MVGPSQDTISSRDMADDGRQLQDVTAQRQAQHLCRDQAGAAQRIIGVDGGDHGQQLGREDRLHTLRRIGIRRTRSQQHDHDLVALPAVYEVRHQARPDLIAIDIGHIRELKIEVRRGGEQLVFVAEVPHHHRRVDVGIRGDRPDGGPFEARLGESFPRRGQDHRLGFGRGSAHANKCRPTTVDIPDFRAHSYANKRWH